MHQHCKVCQELKLDHAETGLSPAEASMPQKCFLDRRPKKLTPKSAILHKAVSQTSRYQARNQDYGGELLRQPLLACAYCTCNDSQSLVQVQPSTLDWGFCSLAVKLLLKTVTTQRCTAMPTVLKAVFTVIFCIHSWAVRTACFGFPAITARCPGGLTMSLQADAAVLSHHSPDAGSICNALAPLRQQRADLFTVTSQTDTMRSFLLSKTIWGF